jgi:thymidylate kinase
MFSVALVGPDGVGKTTIGRRLERTFPLPVKYIYMGDNVGASNLILPTTRLVQLINHVRGANSDEGGPPRLDRRTPARTSWLTTLVSGLVWLNYQFGEEWFRQVLASWYQRRGKIVLFDRHFFCDYYAHEIAADAGSRSKRERLHGLMLKHLFPKPDLVVLLDAPADVLFARKAEGTVESLEFRRREYPQMRTLVRHFAVVDAAQPEDLVARKVEQVILDFHRTWTDSAGLGA